ncbi:MAG: DUF427 domain-containing protein [Pseudomonadota bacterium]
MADHITLSKADGQWSIRAGGAVLGESKNAISLTEGDYPVVVYIPREDIAMAFLDRSEKSTHCPYKGDATYFSVVTKSTTLENVAWSYETPIKGMEGIKDHIAFYSDSGVTVENI